MQSVRAKLTTLFILIGVILLPQAVLAADARISEIMYSLSGADNGYEWVEIHNKTQSSITLTDWNLRENETDHRISIDGTASLAAGERAIIADDPQKVENTYPKLTDVFDSTFSLSNDGEQLDLIGPDGSTVDSVSYDPSLGADGDGKSLQLSSGSWIAATPTPDAANAKQDSLENDGMHTDSEDKESASASGILEPRTRSSDDDTQTQANEKEPSVIIDAGGNMQAMAGVQFRLQGVATTSNESGFTNADVFWSLGNGDTEPSSDTFYTYQHPGEYVATLVYQSEQRHKKDQITIKVDSPNLEISDRTNGADGYTEISNKLDRDVNLSGWHLRAGTKTKTLPDYTIALADSTHTLANQTTGLHQRSIELLYPDGTVADAYQQAQSTSSVVTSTASIRSNTDTADTSEDFAGVASVQDTKKQKQQNRPTSTASQSLQSLFTTSSQTAAAAQSDTANHFWRWALLTAVIVLGGVGITATLGQLTTENRQDLLSDTFDINEM